MGANLFSVLNAEGSENMPAVRYWINLITDLDVGYRMIPNVQIFKCSCSFSWSCNVNMNINMNMNMNNERERDTTMNMNMNVNVGIDVGVGVEVDERTPTWT